MRNIFGVSVFFLAIFFGGADYVYGFDPLRYHPDQMSPERVVESIAGRLGYGCAGWLESLSVATIKGANLDYYSLDMAMMLTHRWGQPPQTFIKGDFWRRGEDAYSRDTIKMLLPLSVGWERKVLEQMLAAKEGWRALGIGFVDVGRLVHGSNCSRTNVSSAGVNSFAKLLGRQVVEGDIRSMGGIAAQCAGGLPVVALEPPVDGRVRWATPEASWIGDGNEWTPIPVLALAAMPSVFEVSDTKSRRLGRGLIADPCLGGGGPSTPPPPPPLPLPEPDACKYAKKLVSLLCEASP